jgi:hypothetical protein
MTQHSGDRMAIVSTVIPSERAMAIATHIVIDIPGGL